MIENVLSFHAKNLTSEFERNVYGIKKANNHIALLKWSQMNDENANDPKRSPPPPQY